MDPDKEKLLKEFLNQLPDRSAAALTRAIERDRLAGATQLPHEAILEGLRPTLRQAIARPPRTPTPQRLFTAPLEDMLVNGPRRQKQRGRILRASMSPVWEWLRDELIPTLHAEMSEKLRVAIISNDRVEIRECVDVLCGAAGNAISQALDELASGKRSRTQLEARLGPGTVEDLPDIAAALEIGLELMELQTQFPRPVLDIGPLEINWIRDRFTNIADHLPDHAPYLMLVLVGRMAKPWEILGVVSQLAHGQSSLMLRSTDLGFSGELLLDDAESFAENVARMKPGQPTPPDLAQELGYFVTLVKGLGEQPEFKKDTEWMARLRTARATVADAMEVLIERAPKTIYAALPVAALGAFGKSAPRKPQTLKPIDPALVEKAISAASLMRATRNHASDGAFSVAHADVMTEVSRFLERYTEDLIAALRLSEQSERPVVRGYLDTACKIVSEVRGEEEADLVRRRGEAALKAGGG